MTKKKYDLKSENKIGNSEIGKLVLTDGLDLHQSLYHLSFSTVFNKKGHCVVCSCFDFSRKDVRDHSSPRALVF